MTGKWQGGGVNVQGVPQNMTASLSLFVTFSRPFNILKTITTKFSYSWHFQNAVCLSYAYNNNINFVQISDLLIKSKLFWTKLFISRANTKKRQTTFWKCQDKEYFVIIFSRILLLKVGWQINAANDIKNQRRPSIRLSTHVLWDTLYVR